MRQNFKQSDGEDILKLGNACEVDNTKQCGGNEETKQMIELQFHGSKGKAEMVAGEKAEIERVIGGKMGNS